ncbi:hypothetical protein C1H87_02080 [Flavivirga eckloniae]|uniref:LVIVD repeat-containing protein n=1 Tax=Flavivirga eckloniae TaxID=1803846 RepID=A0A2K9PKH8_9FLAO|nr:hypothetical protein C1H87_02080 [Flavivirga eckloniae]
MACDSDSQSDSLSSDTGQGGSLAQFTIAGNYLYTVDESFLNVFNIVNPESPVQVNTSYIGFDIETLFHYDNNLYVGSQTGMFIYNLDNPEAPKQLASVSHFRACDPVVANDTHAFVTLDGSTGCGGSISALEIYDTSQLTAPMLVSRRNLIAPKGLGLYNNYLFVCDDEVKVFDISNPDESVLVNAINISAFDVIVRENHLILIGENNVFQYQLNPNDIKNIKELSVLNI